MKAFSYSRYSTPEQGQGDSIRRQIEASRAYAREHNLDLDESLQPDRGISAFKGKNRTEGNLGAFLDDVKTGRVPKGSALLVESLDRISREEVEEAMYQFLDIIRAGIEIHTLIDGAVFRKGQLKTEQLMISLFIMSRANEESATKSARVSKAWKQKKQTASGASAITSRVPQWLEAKLGQPITVNHERAKIVEEIFRLAGSGLGKRRIAVVLNQRGEPTWGKSQGWRYSYVHKILNNRSVLGEYQPFKRTANGRVPDGEPCLDYFPRVISNAEWDAVHANDRPPGGWIGTNIGNLFTGLVFDASLQRAMHFEDKGDGCTYLASDSTRFGIAPNRINYKKFESAFLHFLDQIEWSSVLEANKTGELQRAEEKIASLSIEIQRCESDIEKLTDLLIDTPSKALKERLRKTEAQVEQMSADKTRAEAILIELRSKYYGLMDKSVVYTRLLQTRDLETRARLRREIRRKVSRIDLTFHKDNVGNPEVWIFYQFVNGAVGFSQVNRHDDGSYRIQAVKDGQKYLSAARKVQAPSVPQEAQGVINR
jgi:DNA invertase Pin-like site-specific DNA recombinase